MQALTASCEPVFPMTAWKRDFTVHGHTEKYNLFVLYNKLNSNGLLKDLGGMKKEKHVCSRDLMWLWRHLCVSFNRLRSTTNSENAHRIYVIIILVNFSSDSIWRCQFGNAMARCESRLLFIWFCWMNEPYGVGEVKCPFSKMDMSIEEACD